MYPEMEYTVYRVLISRKVERSINKLRLNEKKKMVRLLDDLRETGPVQPGWKNFSKIGENIYHCHLSYKWVICWKVSEDNSTLEVFYAGSRENAPY